MINKIMAEIKVLELAQKYMAKRLLKARTARARAYWIDQVRKSNNRIEKLKVVQEYL